jgi:3-hydroxyisobutyrate dehydrogenase-like beta-hydroxyacid dehydrogenase
VDIGFIGLGNMGFPIARRLAEAGHTVVAFDTRADVVDKLVTFGARAASSPGMSPTTPKR